MQALNELHRGDTNSFFHILQKGEKYSKDAKIYFHPHLFSNNKYSLVQKVIKDSFFYCIPNLIGNTLQYRDINNDTYKRYLLVLENKDVIIELLKKEYVEDSVSIYFIYSYLLHIEMTLKKNDNPFYDITQDENEIQNLLDKIFEIDLYKFEVEESDVQEK